MWIMLSNAFVSIVADRNDKTNLYVRARVRGDLERVFPGCKPIATPTNADYGFRVSLPAHEVTKAIASQMASITYDNFKNSVKEGDRHDAYLECWNAMHGLQVRRRRVDSVNATQDKITRKVPASRATRTNAPVDMGDWPLVVKKPAGDYSHDWTPPQITKKPSSSYGNPRSVGITDWPSGTPEVVKKGPVHARPSNPDEDDYVIYNPGPKSGL